MYFWRGNHPFFVIVCVSFIDLPLCRATTWLFGGILLLPGPERGWGGRCLANAQASQLQRWVFTSPWCCSPQIEAVQVLVGRDGGEFIAPGDLLPFVPKASPLLLELLSEICVIKLFSCSYFPSRGAGRCQDVRIAAGPVSVSFIPLGAHFYPLHCTFLPFFSISPEHRRLCLLLDQRRSI